MWTRVSGDTCITHEGLGFLLHLLGHPLARNRDIVYRAVKAADDPRQIMRWFEECISTHKTCPSSVKSNDRFSMPTRLLDVDPEIGLGQIRLLKGANCKGFYAALSHCWGGNLTGKTTKALLGPHSSGIEISSLCKTFQDSITTARNLGIPYLWIDSLCIIQDDPDDWKREAESMADVFANAWVTLAASASKDGSGGLFYPRGPENECAIKWTHDESLPPDWVKVRARWEGAWERDVEDAPLNRRGWVLQERLLSPRIVHFGRTQLYWECHGFVESEDGGHYDDKFRLSQNPFTVATGIAPTTLAVRDAWTTSVEAYSKCKLTYQSDKLAAIAGLSKTLERLHQDRYIAGLWESELPFTLYWTPINKHHPVADRLPFPTWSWASVTCPVWFPGLDMGLVHGMGRSGVKSMVSDIEVTIDGSTSESFFSDVKEGKLSLTGYVFSASYDKEETSGDHPVYKTGANMTLSGRNGPIVPRVKADFDSTRECRKPLSALLLFRCFEVQTELVETGLLEAGLVVPAVEIKHYLLLNPLPKAGYYERIGVAYSYEDIHPSWKRTWLARLALCCRWPGWQKCWQWCHTGRIGDKDQWYAREEVRRLTIM
ncbi:HET-domain-containing protein [Coniochaeta ligniaria NRRL 30616]|uniref:HET-domain-containing protein n=1 Tax=Coniochaeta ligniaria NRRL 30616 TaxID=1408157 RepID=A0A1J7IEQ4_9PEZI|nr:HET-domain-containing protein [Coniochaeta ligniaria NRRL 30616]